MKANFIVSTLKKPSLVMQIQPVTVNAQVPLNNLQFQDMGAVYIIACFVFVNNLYFILTFSEGLNLVINRGHFYSQSASSKAIKSRTLY